MNPEKKEKLLTGYRLKLAAFFNNEYALRNIITNKEYSQYITCLDSLT